MAYSDDTVLSKLSALNETQEGIVTAANWILFHRRMAKRTAELWLQRMKESTSHKKLNLIYLANEVVQQSKARKRQDFLTAFSPIIAEATEVAYRNSTPDIQNKIRRVIEVWRQRAIFEPDVQSSIEQRLDDVDKGKSNASSGATGRKPLLGGAFGGSFGGSGSSSAPLEFTPILNSHKGLALKNSSATIAVGSANSEYQKQFDTETLPVPPVYAARLSSLLKTLDSAHIAVKGAIEARETHIRNLERLLSQSKTALENDKNTLKDIVTKRQKTETTKQEVEMMILKGMDEPQNNQTNGSNGGEGAAGSSTEHDAASPKSPEVEALTPPGQPAYDTPTSSASTSMLPPQFHQGASELLASLAAPLSGVKRDKRDEPEVFEGLDDDVADMFRNEQMGSPAKRSKIEEDDEYHP
ncbi:DUF618-domain-containing protein [Choiromyces venosus 120613-1]|uniref:DUF618-domain-containing protein n=1 Tax=Choiromyces venosus 120613-1 TaxID=1336337 RepID=A0A3N4JZ08_9PEZI|nr:DUF618-domain-containing protein [Choiromyces venosus 120613-1]